MPDHMKTRITVHAIPDYQEQSSSPAEERYVFAYTIRIENRGNKPAQLLKRHWVVTDADGHVEEVRGAGVVGLQPKIDPGSEHTYSSGSVITTKVGTMQGSYLMHADDGHEFKAIIAPFRLAVPGALH